VKIGTAICKSKYGCNKRKKLSEFHKDSRRLLGVTSICKKCESTRKKRNYEENRERDLEYCKKYHNENKERVHERYAKYWEGNKERFHEKNRIRAKKYYEENIKPSNTGGKVKYEEILKLILEKNKINFEREKWFRGLVNIGTNASLHFDFYLPDYKLCIEIDESHHNQLKFKQRDQIKTQYCKNNNIYLLRISYKEINKAEQILLNMIKNITNGS